MKTFIVTLASLTFLSVSSFAADYNIANCSSATTGRAVRLILVGQDVKQVRVRINSHRERALTPMKAVEQNVEGATVYTIINSSALMEVDNQILTGNGGSLKLANDEFTCM